jgi:hypothetical protein
MAIDHTSPDDLSEYQIFQQVLDYAMPMAPFHPDDVGYLFSMAVNFACDDYDDELTERFVRLKLHWDRCGRMKYK